MFKITRNATTSDLNITFLLQYVYQWLSPPEQCTPVRVCLCRDEPPCHLHAWGNFILQCPGCSEYYYCICFLIFFWVGSGSFNVILNKWYLLNVSFYNSITPSICCRPLVWFSVLYSNNCLSLQLHQQNFHPQRSLGQSQNAVAMRDLHTSTGNCFYIILKLVCNVKVDRLQFFRGAESNCRSDPTILHTSDKSLAASLADDNAV